MATVTDRALDEEEAGEFRQFKEDTLELLDSVLVGVEPKLIADAIDSRVDANQQNALNSDDELSQDAAIALALGLGSLFGAQVETAFGWEWRCIVEGTEEKYGLVSPNRALAIYPTMFIKSCLDDPNVDCRLMLAFNMLAAGRFDDFPAGGYLDVLDQVVRIVPRR